ncbi:MAG: sulfotransferase family 2 domain-containing protein [Symploca sp. SIO2C1]|nr:sulfotransferase family 2 domain-containing protein [Symploca sp. SIO2C1]
MAIICREYGLLYLMAPRTGCTAVEEVLEKELGGELVPPQDILDEKGNFRMHRRHHSLRAMFKHRLLTKEEAASFLKFSCIRNPYDSLASDYVKRATKYQHFIAEPTSWVHRLPGYVEDMEFCKTHSFDDWVVKHYGSIYGNRWQRSLEGVLRSSKRNRLKQALGIRTKPYLMYGDYTADIDFVMRFENLQNDFDQVLERAGVPFKVTIPVVNKTDERKADYREYYTERSRKIVQYVFREELERYDYGF